MDSYPAEIPVWAIGAATWSMYLLHRLGKSSGDALRLPKLLAFLWLYNKHDTRC